MEDQEVLVQLVSPEVLRIPVPYKIILDKQVQVAMAAAVALVVKEVDFLVEMLLNLEITEELLKLLRPIQEEVQQEVRAIQAGMVEMEPGVLLVELEP
jgi:hypothetical protein